MSYAESVLQPNERILTTGKLHWIEYRWAIFFLLLTVVLLVVGAVYPASNTLMKWTALICFGLFLIAFVQAWFIRWITEIAVTNKRVIYKRGFIRRYTAEINMDKIESVDVDQSILGRVLNYGSLHIRGTGQSIERLSLIAAPLDLRNAIIAK